MSRRERQACPGGQNTGEFAQEGPKQSSIKSGQRRSSWEPRLMIFPWLLSSPYAPKRNYLHMRGTRPYHQVSLRCLFLSAFVLALLSFTFQPGEALPDVSRQQCSPRIPFLEYPGSKAPRSTFLPAVSRQQGTSLSIRLGHCRAGR